MKTKNIEKILAIKMYDENFFRQLGNLLLAANVYST